MINVEMARDYMLRSKRILREAETALSEGDSAASIRRSQESLEMAVKALLGDWSRVSTKSCRR